MGPGDRGRRYRRERAQAAPEVIHGIAAKLPKLRIALSHGNAAELVQVAGFAAVSYGVWLIRHPAGVITAGVLAVLEAFSLERR